MMKIVALLVLIVLATPAFAQDFQEFLKMFTDLGCKETDYIMSDMHRYLKMCDQCLSFQISLEKPNPSNVEFVNSSLIVSQKSRKRLKKENFEATQQEENG
uniref:U18-Nephitoxin-Nsp1v_1 n=1 Tax=Nephila sp. SGP-2016 TaxID=1905176 RepID=A0A4Q8K478_9ARAC